MCWRVSKFADRLLDGRFNRGDSFDRPFDYVAAKFGLKMSPTT